MDVNHMFKKYWSYLVFLISIAIITILCFNFKKSIECSFYSHQSNLRAFKDLPGSFMAAKIAFEKCPRNDEYAVALGNASERMFLQTKNVAFVNLAANAYVWASQVQPFEALNHYLAGIALLQINQTGFSNAHFTAATQLEPNNPVYLRRGR